MAVSILLQVFDCSFS